jgi:ABC-type branched-subunit amino acid transport system substrate-binding protein
MKNLLFLSLFFFIPFTFTQAQSVDTGIQFYEEGSYQKALDIFENINTSEAFLFAGKSHYALTNYLKAKYYLNSVDEADKVFHDEALYTLALVEFQLKNFAASLDALHKLNKSSPSPSVSRDAYDFYNELLDYLSPGQRQKAFISTSYDEVRFDLVEAVMGKVDLGSARSLINKYANNVVDADTSQLGSIRRLLSDSAAYMQRYNPTRYPKAPDGVAYNIGVALPSFDVESPEYEISQHLYFGIQLSIEQFNSENSDLKAFISYRDTKTNPSNSSEIATDLIWNEHVDAIIGPLFSEVALSLSKAAEQFEVPLLTPLANSDQINLDLNYTFQLNPTFKIQGREIAQYAIQTLGYDTLAVIAEKGSLGEASAQAFLDESRNQNAKVVRYYVEELASQGYDITEYVKYFDPEVDTVFNYNIDAVYAPFTGNIAETLINNLLTNLEAMQSELTILGSEEWENVDLENRRLPDNEVYFTKSFEQNSGNTSLTDFESAFRLRFEISPNRFALIGYDAANVLLHTLKKVQNPVYLKQGLKELSNFRGLNMDVSFNGTHINQEVKIKKVKRESDN